MKKKNPNKQTNKQKHSTVKDPAWSTADFISVFFPVITHVQALIQRGKPGHQMESQEGTPWGHMSHDWGCQLNVRWYPDMKAFRGIVCLLSVFSALGPGRSCWEWGQQTRNKAFLVSPWWCAVRNFGMPQVKASFSIIIKLVLGQNPVLSGSRTALLRSTIPFLI